MGKKAATTKTPIPGDRKRWLVAASTVSQGRFFLSVGYVGKFCTKYRTEGLCQKTYFGIILKQVYNFRQLYLTKKRYILTSLYDEKYRLLIRLLVEFRKKAGITQQELAGKLGKPQSFVSKYERCERRLDVIEFLEITEQMDANYLHIIEKLLPGDC